MLMDGPPCPLNIEVPLYMSGTDMSDGIIAATPVYGNDFYLSFHHAIHLHPATRTLMSYNGGTA